MKKVLFNETFKDRYTGKLRVAGKTAELSEDRIKEIKEVNPNFVSVIGVVEEPVTEEPKADKKAEK